MTASSITTAPILDVIVGDCWAPRQLHRGIKDVSVASELMKSLTLVGVVFIDTLGIPELDGGFLHNHWSDPGSDCGRLLGPTTATQRYKIRPKMPFPWHGAIESQEGWWLGWGRPGSHFKLDHVNLPVY